MKKAQAAMEFLMTYGWAILVVLAAIGALAYFGVLSPDRFMPSKCTIGGGFSCAEYKLDGTTTPKEVKIYVQNNLGADADVVTIYLEDNEQTPCLVAVGGDDFFNITGGLPNGVTASVPAVFTAGCDISTAVSGGSFKGNIKVVYQKNEENEMHTAGGTISGKFEYE